MRGALVAGMAQGTAFVLRTGSMIAMARLLFPRDFGLFGMVTAFTGVLALFRDFGLSMASVTNITVTEAQLSTLFWVNLAAGVTLTGVCALSAPGLAFFYHEPRLVLITLALSTGFLFSGASVQHRALLQRAMRFGSIAIADTAGLMVGIAAAITMATLGFGYWALVVLSVMPAAVSAVCVWAFTGWIPGRPVRQSGVRSMLWYGGTVTLNNFVVYVAYNADNVLVGRFWGAEALGIYGRAFQLISIPTENLNSTISQVAFPALARLRNEPAKLNRYFLRGYSLFFALVVPLTASCALFAEDIVQVFLGPHWRDVVPIFRLLAPTMLVFAVINPFGWLMMATGYTARSLRIALMICPVVILACFFGLKGGPQGVAAGFSAAMLLLAIPVVVWAKYGTAMTARDVVSSTWPPLVAVAFATAITFVVSRFLTAFNLALLHLSVESAIFFGSYAAVLLFGLRRYPAYLMLLREIRPVTNAG
ncbi:MAG TPA: lipopolysaccharide biosynthesis protein [Vicinamibacterales bacterium]